MEISLLPVPPPLSLSRSPSLRLLPFCSHKHLPIPPIPFNNYLFACLLGPSHTFHDHLVVAFSHSNSRLFCRSPSSGSLVLYENKTRRFKHSSHRGSAGNYSLVKAKKVVTNVSLGHSVK